MLRSFEPEAALDTMAELFLERGSRARLKSPVARGCGHRRGRDHAAGQRWRYRLPPGSRDSAAGALEFFRRMKVSPYGGAPDYLPPIQPLLDEPRLAGRSYRSTWYRRRATGPRAAASRLM